ncbi:hypothetical protein [Streptomyces sp. 1222.5]
MGRTTILARTAAAAAAALLTPAGSGYLWTGWAFSAFPVESAW